jgi:hypothetical protein
VADAGAGFRRPLNVRLVKPDAVAERHLWAEQTEAVDVFHRRAAAAPAGVFLRHPMARDEAFEKTVNATGDRIGFDRLRFRWDFD